VLLVSLSCRAWRACKRGGEEGEEWEGRGLKCGFRVKGFGLRGTFMQLVLMWEVRQLVSWS
jgi:hypothetical protein